MDTKKLIIAACAAAAGVITMTAGGVRPDAALDAAIVTARNTAYLSAGITVNTPESDSSDEYPQTTEAAPDGQAPESAEGFAESAEEAEQTSESAEVEPAARVISRNITAFDDGIDRTSEGTRSGVIVREHLGGYQGDDYITLAGGGVVWNCTNDSAESILAAESKTPEISLERNTAEPQVLIVHTHTTESYEPYQRDYYDSSCPERTRDPEYNMIRVGEALAERLCENGISVLHDGTIHDYPSYTGSYDRSEATIRAALEEYPSIKLILDIHRDALTDGTVRTAPVSEINGSSAAQFMIITGCDDGRFGSMPNYAENLSLACALQNAAEALYPGLARPILFDYRNYNQHISTGSLLIEIGGHANSLDEAVYTARLLGDIIAGAS